MYILGPFLVELGWKKYTDQSINLNKIEMCLQIQMLPDDSASDFSSVGDQDLPKCWLILNKNNYHELQPVLMILRV